MMQREIVEARRFLQGKKMNETDRRNALWNNAPGAWWWFESLALWGTYLERGESSVLANLPVYWRSNWGGFSGNGG